MLEAFERSLGEPAKLAAMFIPSVSGATTKDGREFVLVEQFLTCFPKATEATQRRFRRLMDESEHKYVEKRINESLRVLMVHACHHAPSGVAERTPTVVKEGFVFWLTEEFREEFMETMVCLTTGKDSAVPYEFFHEKIGWTMDPKHSRIIYIPKGYIETAEDKKIFEAFNLSHVD